MNIGPAPSLRIHSFIETRASSPSGIPTSVGFVVPAGTVFRGTISGGFSSSQASGVTVGALFTLTKGGASVWSRPVYSIAGTGTNPTFKVYGNGVSQEVELQAGSYTFATATLGSYSTADAAIAVVGTCYKI